MTEIQTIHRIEQCEACRRDFEKHWRATLQPLAKRLHLPAKQLPILYHVAWYAFREGRLELPIDNSDSINNG